MADNNQRDLVLSPNEYAFILDETKGSVTCWAGPSTTSLTQSSRLVRFDSRSKKFIACERFSDAIRLFTTCPEGWYVILKNPTVNGQHPSPGASNNLPDLEVGRKINIKGPANFALYPGQMANVVRGHVLRSNQYLVARVYDADALYADKKDDESDEDKSERMITGQVLIIKGTECSFYIPPTGIEVKAIDNDPDRGYVRDAITLERLEYCILKDEDGNKRYVHGPAVVFPKPSESFIQDGNGTIKRNAIELSDISGVYVKVIADYTDEKGKEHKTGDELFITGKDQMIYYPRPEHTFITYNNRIMNHAIAIPKGEGRYIMNRMTGEIKTVHGPTMYLPDPRFEVSVKRVLSRSQCDLWYPGNQEVLAANGYGVMGDTKTFGVDQLNTVVGTFSDSTMYCAEAVSYTGTPTKKENNKLNRSNTFTPPRTVSLASSKFEGAVGIDVWTGYAVNVISKDGGRRVVCGPQTILLDYDETLETMELSTGKPKTTDNLEHIAFLRHENNRVSDIINVETADFVKADIKVSYLVNFDMDMKDKWFSVDNYVKHLCDWCRAAVKKAVKKFSITDLCDNVSDILLAAITDAGKDEGYLHKFNENGMMISDAEILSLNVDRNIREMIDDHQEEIVRKALELNAAQMSAETDKRIRALAYEQEKSKEEYRRMMLAEKAESDAKAFALEVAANEARNAEDLRAKEAQKQLQVIEDAIVAARIARDKAKNEADIEYKTALDELQAEAENRAAENMKKVLEAVGPELTAALTMDSNKEILAAIAKSVSPYAIANGDSVSDAINTVLRGTTLETVVKNMQKT